MRIRRQHKVREIAGERVVVLPAADDAGADMTRIVSLNDTSCCLWEALQGRDFTEEDAVRLLTERYDVDERTARRDARSWIERLVACGIVEP